MAQLPGAGRVMVPVPAGVPPPPAPHNVPHPVQPQLIPDTLDERGLIDPNWFKVVITKCPSGLTHKCIHPYHIVAP